MHPSRSLLSGSLFCALLSVPVLSASCEAAEACGLECSAEGVLEGNATISGIAGIDAFFGAVIDVGAAANSIEADVRASLDAIALSLEIDPTGLEMSDLAGQVRGALEAKFSATLEGGITIAWSPPQCSASVEVAASAAAECDAEVDPGELPRCEGSCQIDASAAAECEAAGTLMCEGTAPELSCSGTCSGTCSVELEAAATCEGTCRGSCSVECELNDAEGNCASHCAGMCDGTCDVSLEAGGTCEGRCEGSCEYAAPEGGCEASATVKCEASADANIECKGGCDGEVRAPSVSAECEATVEAKANASAECTPPTLDIQYQFAASVDAQAQAEFKAWLAGFRVHFSGMLAASGRASLVANAAASLGGAATGALDTFVSGIVAEGDFVAAAKARCAIGQLGHVATVVTGASGSLAGSIDAVTEITFAVGG